MKVSVLGIDLGKNVCSLVGLDETGAVVLRRQEGNTDRLGRKTSSLHCRHGSLLRRALSRPSYLQTKDMTSGSCRRNMCGPTSRRRRTTIVTRKGSPKRRRVRQCGSSR